MIKEKKGQDPKQWKVGMLPEIKSLNLMHITNNIFQQRYQSIISTTASSGESTPWNGKVVFIFYNFIWWLGVKNCEHVIRRGNNGGA